MKHLKQIKYLLAGGTVLAATGLFIEPQGLFNRPPDYTCQQIIQPKSLLSRRELSQLLAIPERNSKEKVKQLLQEPYCRLSSVEIRQGTVAQREAYPLEFDTSTWLILLYEGDEYAGYSFAFRR